MTDVAQPAPVGALDVFVELFSELDSGSGPGSRGFYDRCCEAVCRLTSMRRAGLLLYDDTRKLVVPVGSHGVPAEILEQIYGNLEETPIAQRALAEDRVMQASERLQRELPARYARFAGVTTLTCTPVAAAGRWLGVIFADRGGGRFELTEQERHTLWTLGKAAALAQSARIATTQQERAGVLAERIDLAREIHERVMQRLFGVSLALASDGELGREQRRRCEEELQAALADLRSALARPLATRPAGTRTTLREELERLRRHYAALPLEVDWQDGCEVPDAPEALAQSLLAEALRNAAKHARPSYVRVSVGRVDGAFSLEVRNDGVCPDAGAGAGMGLRLAAFEALEQGGVVEFGRERDEWRVRLVVPIG